MFPRQASRNKTQLTLDDLHKIQVEHGTKRVIAEVVASRKEADAAKAKAHRYTIRTPEEVAEVTKFHMGARCRGGRGKSNH